MQKHIHIVIAGYARLSTQRVRFILNEYSNMSYVIRRHKPNP